MANRGPGQVDLKWHVLSAVVVMLVTPVVALLPLIVGVAAALLAFPAIVGFLLLKRGSLRRKWPTLDHIERGPRRFEAKKGQILSIELRRPRRMRSGFVTVTPLSGDPFIFKIKDRRTFRVARNLLVGFEAARVKEIE